MSIMNRLDIQDRARILGLPVEGNSMRRFTRLTNGFSKKIENLECAVALHFMHYNFGHIHKTPRVMPAMEAGVADHVWPLGEIEDLADSN